MTRVDEELAKALAVPEVPRSLRFVFICDLIAASGSFVLACPRVFVHFFVDVLVLMQSIYPCAHTGPYMAAAGVGVTGVAAIAAPAAREPAYPSQRRHMRANTKH